MAFDPATYEFRSKEVKEAVFAGRDQGRNEGRVEMIIKLLSQRFGPLSFDSKFQLRWYSDSLESIADRMLTAKTLEEALGTRSFWEPMLSSGRHYGRLEGHAEIVIKVLSQRFGSLTDEAKKRVRASKLEALDLIADRALTAVTLEAALGSN